MRGQAAFDSTTLRDDGTAAIVAGAVIAGLASLAYEVVGARQLGVEGFAPVSALLTLHFLAFVVVLIPLEQVIIRRLTQDPGRPGVPVGAVSLVLGTAAFGGIATWALRNELFNDDGWYAALVAATVLTHGLFVLGRGYLAGNHGYRRYGGASALASLTRLGVALVIVVLVTDGRWFGVALVVAPLVIIGLRPFGPPRRSQPVVDTSAVEGRLLSGLMLASATAQTMLLAGPVIAALLGADAATVSTLFAAFTLLRAPLSLGNNVIARIVPPLTHLADDNRLIRLAVIARRVALSTVVLAGPIAAAAASVGPTVIERVFGEGFRPQTLAIALISAGVVVAAGSVVIGQVFVARGDTGRLADSWLIAVAIAAAVLLIPGPGVMTRVAAAFLVGEVAALGLLTLHTTRPVRDREHDLRTFRWYDGVKRGLDIAIATILLIVLSPVLIAIAAVTRFDSGRPVLLRQRRVGRGGHPFAIWKIRTMAPDADPAVFWGHIRDLAEAAESGRDDQPDLHITHDPRLTRAGRQLRRWSLDELPNLWNVMSGEMSLVGPRPLLSEEVDLIRHELGPAAADQRASVRPGITGLAQVEGRDDISLMERSRLDLQYVSERSLSLDLWLLMRTAVGVFLHRGA